MASLVTALAADHAAAASGTAEFYSMGTATLSSLVYSDANGTSAVTSTTLNAYGSAVRYVGEPVDVVIKNAAGGTVMQFTHIDDGRLVRVETSPYSGPNAIGQTVVGGRTTATAALAQTSISGTTIASGSFQVFNVLSYGASNTGSAFAQTAIKSAIAAATAAGGGVVYLPAGTYIINAPISAVSPANVSIVGDGPELTIIKNSGTTTNAITFTYGGALAQGNNILRDFSITANTTTTGAAISVTDGARLVVSDVHISGHATGIFPSATIASDLHSTFIRCRVLMAGVAANNGYSVGANSRHCRFVHCYVSGGAASGNEFGFEASGSYTQILGCTMENLATGAACGIRISAASTGVSITRCVGSGNDADLLIAVGGHTLLDLDGNQFSKIDTANAQSLSISRPDSARMTSDPQAFSSALVTFTAAPDFSAASALVTYVTIISTYAVGIATVTVAPTFTLAPMRGTEFEFTFLKQNANALNITWGGSFAWRDIGETITFGGLASVASANTASVRFRWSGANMVLIGVSATVAQ